jgi:hypothetical protein
MSLADQQCDLCGLPIERHPYELRSTERTYIFCCDACKGIFQMLNDVEELPEADAKESSPGEDKR